MSSQIVKNNTICDWKPINHANFENESLDIQYLDYSPKGTQIALAFKKFIVFYNPKRQYSIKKNLSSSFSADLTIIKYSHSGQILACGIGVRYYIGDYYQHLDNRISLWECINYTELRIFNVHERLIYSIVFSRNQSKIMTGSQDGSIKIWKTESGLQDSDTIFAHNGGVEQALYANNDKYIISGGKDQRIKIWDAATKNLVREIHYHQDYVKYLLIQESYFLSCSHDGSICFWNIETGLLKKIILSLKEKIICIDYMATSKLIVSGSRQNNTKLWDATKKKQIRVLRRIATPVYQVKFSPDGRFILDLSEGGFSIISLLQ